MARLRKYHVHKSVIFKTYSIEEGLLLLSNPLMELVIKSSFAHAQYHHPMVVCDLLVSSTHVHLIAVVDNPDDVKGFAERFKTESAHRINRILGRPKRTVWCKGYDSPILRGPEEVVDEIIYTLTNPAKDNLEDSIEEYPGISSWKMAQRGEFEKQWPCVPRDEFRALAPDSHCLRGYTKEAKEILSRCKKTLPFKIAPDAWMGCFDINDSELKKHYKDMVRRGIKEREATFRKERAEKKQSVIGKTRLQNEVLNPYHRPNRKKGRKMWCISRNIEERKKFITFLKDLSEEAKDVYRRWKQGDFSVPFPLGLYPPSMPKLAHPIVEY